jgi:RNA recognition motif-containing protein
MADSAACSLFVSQLPTGFTEDQVKAVFGHYGVVSAVKVLPPHPEKPDAAAIVTMESPEKAKWMIENVSGKIPQGLQTPVDIKQKRSGNFGGSGGDWGKGFGKGGFLPPWAMMQLLQWQWGKGKGGGLSSFPAEKKVWIGGLPEDGSIAFKDLQEHFASVGQPKFAAVMKGNSAGTGGVAFATPEEATEAIAKLNGSVLQGHTLVVDVWTKKEKEADAPAPA